jgi:hypothetical protein
MNKPIQLQAIFSYHDDLLSAIRALQEENITLQAVHSPVRNREITALTTEKDSPVRIITLCGAILGILSGFGLSVFTAWQWKFIVSGKPPVPIVPYVIEAFEFCILFGVLFNVLGMLLLSRLPKRTLPAYYDTRVSQDRFSVLVKCRQDARESVRKILHDAGAEEIHGIT